MLDGWQVQTPRPLDETVCRVWGASVRRCVLKGEHNELPVDVVELRLIPQRFEHGCRLPAHGTVTIDVRSDDVRLALEELSASGAAVVLERPDGGVVAMRFRALATTRSSARPDGSSTPARATFSWRAP